MDLFISMIFIATQTLVMFFFVGTGVSIKEYIQENPSINSSYHHKSIQLKRKLYPPTMAVTIFFVAMVILDGLYIIDKFRKSGFMFLMD